VVTCETGMGRLVRKLKATKGRRITALAASPDAKTLYFGADGFIWAIPAIDGNPQKIASGDKVTVDPNGRELILTQSQGSNPVLVKVSVAGGKREMLHVQNGASGSLRCRPGPALELEMGKCWFRFLRQIPGSIESACWTSRRDVSRLSKSHLFR
jgi:hypothetical protein